MQRPGPTGDKIDITNSVQTGTLSIDQDQIAILNVVIDRQVSAFMEFISVGYVLHWYGGHLDKENYYSKSSNVGDKLSPDSFTYNTDNSEFFKYLFKGTVHQVKPTFSEDGTKTITLTCKDFTWGQVSHVKNHFAYPAKNSTRKFADKESMTTRDIVEGICKDTGLRLGQFEIGEEHTYTVKEPAVQHNMTDWAFLLQLGKDHGCYVFTEIDGNDYVLNFVQGSKARNTAAKIEFIYLERDDVFEFVQYKQLQQGDTQSELSKLADNQIKLDGIDLTINQQYAFGQIVQKITDFNVDGSRKEVLVSYDETADEIIYYELNQKKVEALVRTNPDLANKISNMGPMGIPKEIWKEYYIPRVIPKDRIKAIDQPMFGIELNGNSVGNLNVLPFMSYAVYGLGKWSTRPNGRLKYYMTGIEHTWSPGDFTTSYTFKA